MPLPPPVTTTTFSSIKPILAGLFGVPELSLSPPHDSCQQTVGAGSPAMKISSVASRERKVNNHMDRKAEFAIITPRKHGR
jgi:hypothetical protein